MTDDFAVTSTGVCKPHGISYLKVVYFQEVFLFLFHPLKNVLNHYSQLSFQPKFSFCEKVEDSDLTTFLDETKVKIYLLRFKAMD